MEISESKTLFLEYGLDFITKDQIEGMFPFQFKEVESQFKYLGFFLNPINDPKEDWYWILKRIEKRK